MKTMARSASHRFLSFLLCLSTVAGMIAIGNVGSLAVSNTPNMSVLEEGTFVDGTYFEVSMPQSSGKTRYDDYLAIACLQGILNRESPWRFYLKADSTSEEWQEIMQSEGYWLENVEFEPLSGFMEMMALGKDYVKAVILWDENVPASVNAATTAAGVEDGIPMTGECYERYRSCFNEDIKIIDLRGKFDGSVTGSPKNDAYRWAIEEYLDKGLCSKDYICSYFDAWNMRVNGDWAYLCQRDWAVYNRAFVYDLSVWPDEAPYDEPDQPVGTDYETYVMILERMLELTKDSAPYEVTGFFNFTKYSQNGNNTQSAHDTVATEWETVHLITPYNAYQNTGVEWCLNQSFHSQYTGAQQLTNNRPEEELTLEPFTTYLCFFMGDYDSAYPLYKMLPEYWKDEARGELPLAWGINPNLLDAYPDIIEYYYNTATENDYFVSDAGAAGYFNPSRVTDELWPNLLEHNKAYFQRADMTIAPMILDRDRLSDKSLEMFTQFAPDGLATIIIPYGSGGSQAPNLLYNETPATQLYNNFVVDNVDAAVQALKAGVNDSNARTAYSSAIALFRCVWTTPSYISAVVDAYKAANPYENVVVVDIYNYFNLLRQDLVKGKLGDLNDDGNVDATDALTALQYSVNLTALNETQQMIGDVTNDDKVDAADALMILQNSVGLIWREDFPAAW